MHARTPTPPPPNPPRLQEFFALLNFVAPELLGTAPAFKRVFADPIQLAQDRNATPDDKDLGGARAA